MEEIGILKADVLNRITKYVRRGVGRVIRGVNKVVVGVRGSVAVGLCDAEGFGGQEEHERLFGGPRGLRLIC